ncbi:uncharacterized protein [Choristoneura fumiferana]|uniref:uncharacterized protein n=1 Tax=Choristoneura fumiferana TaxID=7141 RepID=UPI003D15E890
MDTQSSYFFEQQLDQIVEDQDLYELCEKVEQEYFKTSLQAGQGGDSKKRSASSSTLTEEPVMKKIKLQHNPPASFASTSTASSSNQNVSTENNERLNVPYVTCQRREILFQSLKK